MNNYIVSLLKHFGILVLFAGVFALVLVFPNIIFIIFLMPLSFLKGLAIKEEKSSVRVSFVIINFLLVFLSFISVFYIFRDFIFKEEIGEDIGGFGLFLFAVFYLFIDQLLFPLGMFIRNMVNNKNK